MARGEEGLLALVGFANRSRRRLEGWIYSVIYNANEISDHNQRAKP